MNIKSQEKYEVKCQEIGYLVATLSHLDINKKTQSELLEVYYDSLKQGIQNGFSTDTLVVENKPNLYILLNSQGLIASTLESKVNHKNIKQLVNKKSIRK